MAAPPTGPGQQPRVAIAHAFLRERGRIAAARRTAPDLRGHPASRSRTRDDDAFRKWIYRDAALATSAQKRRDRTRSIKSNLAHDATHQRAIHHPTNN